MLGSLITDTGVRRSARLATPATAGGGSAIPTPALPPPALPPPAPAGITKPTGCFYVYPKSGLQCRNKPEPYDCVCYHHVYDRPVGAPVPCPPGHKLHPEPIRLPTPYRQFVISAAKEIKDLCAYGRDWTSLRDSELGEEIRRYIDIIDHQNPHISHPVALKYSHRSHMTLVSLVAFAHRLADTFADWKAGRILQNQAVATIRADAHTLYAGFQGLTEYDAPWRDPSLIED